MVVSESLENYLETILMLSKKLPVVRAVDIASHLNFKKSSVSVAMKTLRENGYISVSEEGWIHLTDEGKAVADNVYEKHLYISSMLESLGVDKVIATEDACKIEHIISNESFLAIKRYVENNCNK